MLRSNHSAGSRSHHRAVGEKMALSVRNLKVPRCGGQEGTLIQTEQNFFHLQGDFIRREAIVSVEPLVSP